VKGTGHGQCLTEETLTEYLEGVLDPAVKAASEVHLVACSECREQLAFFMHLLALHVTEEETDRLAAIQAAWNDKQPARRPRRWKFTPYFAVAAIAVVFGAGLLSVQLFRYAARPTAGAEVVQLLLEKSRPFEARLSGQPHRRLVRTRGTEPAPDVSYRALAEELTRAHADNSEMGRFYLLQKDFARAIPYLEIAGREPGASAGTHNDLGVAYFESGNPSKSDMAESEFLHALSRDRTFAPAAFNLALYYERTNDAARAETHWKRYLDLDRRSAWAAEAEERLHDLRGLQGSGR